MDGFCKIDDDVDAHVCNRKSGTRHVGLITYYILVLRMNEIHYGTVDDKKEKDIRLYKCHGIVRSVDSVQ